MPDDAKVGQNRSRKKTGPPKGVRIGGRQKGTPNRITKDIREVAQKYGVDCIEGYARLLKHKTPQVRMQAYQALLDRGYGKPAQSLDIDTKTAITVNLTTFSGKQLPIASMAAPNQWSQAALIGPSRSWPDTNGSGNGSGNGSSDPTAE